MVVFPVSSGRGVLSLAQRFPSMLSSVALGLLRDSSRPPDVRWELLGKTAQPG